MKIYSREGKQVAFKMLSDFKPSNTSSLAKADGVGSTSRRQKHTLLLVCSKRWELGKHLQKIQWREKLSLTFPPFACN